MGKNNLSCNQRTGPLLSNRVSVQTLFHENNNAENNQLYLTENKALSSFLSKQEPWALLSVLAHLWGWGLQRTGQSDSFLSKQGSLTQFPINTWKVHSE